MSVFFLSNTLRLLKLWWVSQPFRSCLLLSFLPITRKAYEWENSLRGIQVWSTWLVSIYGTFLQDKGSLCSGFLGSFEFQFLSSQTSKAAAVLDLYFFFLCLHDALWELANALKGKHEGHLGFTHCISLFSRILAPKVLAAFVTLLWLQTAVFCNIFSFYSCS